MWEIAECQQKYVILACTWLKRVMLEPDAKKAAKY